MAKPSGLPGYRDIAAEYGINPPGATTDAQWWRESPETSEITNPLLVGSIDSIYERQSTRYNNIRRLISIFEWGYRAGVSDAVTSGDCPIDEEYLSYNVAYNILSSLHAKITKNDIVPMPMTIGGSFTQRRRARQLGHGIDGVFDECDVASVDNEVEKDMLITGCGFFKARITRENRVGIDQLHSEHLAVDENEGRYGKPRTIGCRVPMDRFVALAEFASEEDADDLTLAGDREGRARAILNCPVAQDRGYDGYEERSGQIFVYEGWHLPSRKPKKGDDGEWEPTDGRHQIAIDGYLLVDEPYRAMRFPIVKVCAEKRRRSYWGISKMHQLASGQREYEKLTEKVQRAHHKMGGTHIIAAKGSVDPGEWGNEQGTLVEVAPNPMGLPQTFNPEPVNPATYGYRRDIPTDMTNGIGLSEMSTRSQLPAGLQNASGKAIQVYDDFESERLTPFYKARERAHVELGEIVIDLIRQIVEESDEPYRVQYKHQKWMNEIDWNKVLLDESEYRLIIEAASNLPNKPAARYEQLSEMYGDGRITVEQFRRLWLQGADFENENELDSADTDIIDENLEKMALDGVYLSPQPFDNLALYVKRAGTFYNLCRVRGCPAKNLALIMDAIKEAQRLQAPPPAAVPPGAPTGAPAMPPTPAAPPPQPMAPMPVPAAA